MHLTDQPFPRTVHAETTLPFDFVANKSVSLKFNGKYDIPTYTYTWEYDQAC